MSNRSSFLESDRSSQIKLMPSSPRRLSLQKKPDPFNGPLRYLGRNLPEVKWHKIKLPELAHYDELQQTRQASNYTELSDHQRERQEKEMAREKFDCKHFPTLSLCSFASQDGPGRAGPAHEAEDWLHVPAPANLC